MTVINLDIKGKCAVIRMVNGENRFTIAFLNEYMDALDKILQTDCTMLITTGSNKYFSNGLDLDWLLQQDHDVKVNYMNNIYSILKRVLTFPLPTLAAINGHAYAGGAILALCHDYRVMNKDKGWFCLPEVHMGLSFTDALISLLKAKVTAGKTLTDCILFGKKCNAQLAMDYELVDGISSIDSLLQEGEVLLAKKTSIGTSFIARDTLHDLKKGLYHSAVIALGPSISDVASKL